MERRRSARLRCLRRYGRTPGRVTGPAARGVSKSKIELSFSSPGTDGSRGPAATAYVVRQSLRPIRSAREFRLAQTLCNGACRFPITRVGELNKLTIADLRPRTTYYYAIAARDNVSGRLGPRSRTVSTKTR
jgi:hypothetical protein